MSEKDAIGGWCSKAKDAGIPVSLKIKTQVSQTGCVSQDTKPAASQEILGIGVCIYYK